MKIIIKEEKINNKDSIRILNHYYASNDERYKSWLKEITQFRDHHPKKGIIGDMGFVFLKLGIKLKFKKFKNYFIYKWVVFWNKKLEKNEVFLKWSIGDTNKVFIKIKKKNLKDWKSIFIKEIISIEKWLWRKAINELCKHYNIYNITVEPSVYSLWFWEKLRIEYKWKINIVINIK